MGKLWAITAREYLERVRSRWFVIATVFGPLFFGALMILPPWLQARSKASKDVAQIAILDATGTDLGRRVASELSGGVAGDTSRTRVLPVPPAELAAAESAAMLEVRRKAARGYLVLDAETLAGLRARYVGHNATAVSDMEAVQRAVRDNVLAVRLEREGVSPGQVSALTRMRLRLEAERVADRGRGGSAQATIIFAVAVAVLLYISIVFYGQAVLRGVLEEKQTRVAEVVLSSVPSRQLLAGKVLGVGAVGLTQLVIWIAASVLLWRLRAPLLEHLGAAAATFSIPSIPVGTGVVLLLFFLLGYTLYAGLMAMVGSMVNTEQEAQQVQMPVMVVLIASAALIGPVIANPGGTMARVMSIVPFSAPIIMPLRMSLLTLSPLEIGAALLSIAVTCYVVVLLAARIYRVGLLMYGKRPTLRELSRWVRYAG